LGNEPRLAKRIDVHSLNAIGLRLRSDTVSVFNGPPPTIASLKDEAEEIKTVANWLRERAKAGVLPHELGIFVRSEGQLERARAAAQEAQMAFRLLDEKVDVDRHHAPRQGPRFRPIQQGTGLKLGAIRATQCVALRFDETQFSLIHLDKS
jgi:hypothetical protein